MRHHFSTFAVPAIKAALRNNPFWDIDYVPTASTNPAVDNDNEIRVVGLNRSRYVFVKYVPKMGYAVVSRNIRRPYVRSYSHIQAPQSADPNPIPFNVPARGKALQHTVECATTYLTWGPIKGPRCQSCPFQLHCVSEYQTEQG